MSVGRRVSRAIATARSGATQVVARVPRTARAATAGMNDTTSAIQTLPNSTLRWLAAASAGLGAGFYLAGAPRVVVAAGVAPALIVGAAMILRPIAPIAPNR